MVSHVVPLPIILLCNARWLNSYIIYVFSLEDPGSEQEDSTGGETSYRESYDDITVNELLNHIPTVSHWQIKKEKTRMLIINNILK